MNNLNIYFQTSHCIQFL